MAKKLRTMGELLESLFSMDEIEYDDATFWSTDVRYFRIWREFLCLSESYEHATMEYWQELDDCEIADLPEDFNLVRETFSDFGLLVDMQFTEWWLSQGMRICGTQASMPRSTVVTTIDHEDTDRLRAPLMMDDYIQSQWQHQGQQNTVVIAIPMGLDQTTIIREIKAILHNANSQDVSIVRPQPKYVLRGKRQSPDTIMKYFRAIVTRAYFPKWDLVQVGLFAKVSSTYDEKRLKANDPEDRRALQRETSKAINRGWHMAENAARGIFPDYRKCDHALPLDLVSIRARFEQIEYRRTRDLKDQENP